MRRIDRLVVCGLGLIGGSFALALREAKAANCIVGLDSRTESVARALEIGMIDETAADWRAALKNADLVMLAIPVGQIDAALAAMAPFVGDGTVITDAGSTKRDITEAARRHLATRLQQVVPGHPIAGTEKSGVDAGFASLFRGKRAIVTPLSESAPDAIEAVRYAWQCCGAKVACMAPDEHDRVFAAVSHLPHLLAYGLVDDLAARPNAEQLFSYAASGFRDFTRIAGSHPEMWRDICVTNRVAILAELDRYLDELKSMRALLECGDAAGLEAVFERASQARNAWAEANLPYTGE